MDSSRETQLARLNEYIDAASTDELRYIVRKLCAKSTTFSNYLTRKLLDPEEPEEPETVPEESETVSKYFSKKTPATNDDENARRETCERCGEKYGVEGNGPTSCVWHDGELKVDYDGDFWEDKEDGYRWTDTDWSRENYPGGYIWECCQQIGVDIPGCQTGHHVPKPRQ
ncbi:hypothetical protein RB594_006388 [Gaeumannomyces avenae]